MILPVRAPQVEQGLLVWAWLDPSVGREQSGRRPVIVIGGDGYLSTVESLAIVMPLTTTRRDWPNHVPVTPADLLPEPSWIMTEQVRSISRDRLVEVIGKVTTHCLAEALRWLRDFTT